MSADASVAEVYGTMLTAQGLRRSSRTKSSDSGSSNGSSTASEDLIWNDIVREKCAVCEEAFDERRMLHLKCGHHYCTPCLTDWISKVYKEESLYPPECCTTEISLAQVKPLLPKLLTFDYQHKIEEYRTPSLHRIYCPQPNCGVWLPPNDPSYDQLKCHHCHHGTCKICKKVAHEGDCPDDEAAAEMRKFAKEKGWQQCPHCHCVVQLREGCNHMKYCISTPPQYSTPLMVDRCRCGGAFCYECGKVWRTCDCKQWTAGELALRLEREARDGNGFEVHD